MQLLLPPIDLRDAVECAIVVERAAGSLSRFPAMPRAMLTLAPGATGAWAVSFDRRGECRNVVEFTHSPALRTDQEALVMDRYEAISMRRGIGISRVTK